MLGFDNLVSQTRTVRDEDFQLLFLLLHILVQQLVVRVQTSLTLCLTGLGSHAHPFQLAFQRFAALACHFFFHFHAFGLLLQPARIVSLPGDTFATVEFQNPSGHVIKEVTVVRHGDYRSFILLQMLFQPVDAFCIQVVGRLVQQKDVRLLKQQAAQSHTAAFTSRKVLHRLVFGRTAQRIHRTFQLAVQVPCVCSVNDILQFGLAGEKRIHLFRIFIIFRKPELLVDFFIFRQCVHGALHTFHHHLLDRLFIVELRFLSQIAHRIARRENHFALIVLVQSGDNLQQRRLSRTVQTDDTDLRSVEKG